MTDTPPLRLVLDWHRTWKAGEGPETDFIAVMRGVGYGRVHRMADRERNGWYWFASTWDGSFIDGFSDGSRHAAGEAERHLVEQERRKRAEEDPASDSPVEDAGVR